MCLHCVWVCVGGVCELECFKGIFHSGYYWLKVHIAVAHDPYIFHKYTVTLTKAQKHIFAGWPSCRDGWGFSANHSFVSFFFLSYPMGSHSSITNVCYCFSALRFNPQLQGNKIFWTKSINYTKEAKRWPDLWIMHRPWLCSAWCLIIELRVQVAISRHQQNSQA